MAVLPTKICNHSTIHHHSPPSPLKEFLKNAPPPAHYVSCFCISGFIFQYSALSLPGLLREPSPLTMGLPTISLAELEQNASSKSCYVTIGSKVYDVTSFISDHPGGGDLILEFVANSPPPFSMLMRVVNGTEGMQEKMSPRFSRTKFLTPTAMPRTRSSMIATLASCLKATFLHR